MNNQTGFALLSHRLFLFLAAAGSLVIICIYFCNWFASLSWPYSINFEGTMLFAAQALAAGANIYANTSLNHEPLLVTIYPPLYLLLAAALVKVFGVHYLPLRVANMVLSVGTGGLLFRIMSSGGRRLSACLCALVFLFSFDIMSLESFEARPDYLVIFLSVFMLERFVRIYVADNGAQSLTRYAPVLLLGLLAINAKQQAVVFLLSLVLFLLMEGQKKLALQFTLIWSCGLCLSIFLMQMLTGGYLAHLTFLAATKSSPTVLTANLGGLGLDWIKVCWSLLVLPFGILTLKKLSGLQKLPFVLLFVSTSLFLYSMGIPASNSNHMMSALVALAWCLAVCLTSLPAWVGIGSLLACSLSFVHLSEEARLRPLLLPYARAGAAQLQKLNLAGKQVLTDDLYINMLSGSQAVIVDCPTFLNVWSAKGSDFKQLTGPLFEKRYAAVIINSEDSQMLSATIWWPRKVVQAIKNNYHRAGELHCSGWSLDVYLPGQEAIAPVSLSPANTGLCDKKDNAL